MGEEAGEDALVADEVGTQVRQAAGLFVVSRCLIDDPDERLEIRPGRCRSCDASLVEATEHGHRRRQIVDIQPAPPPKVTEYVRISKVCACCGVVTTPGWDDEAVPVEHVGIVAAPGSPVRIGGVGSARKPSPAPRCSPARTTCPSGAPATCWRR